MKYNQNYGKDVKEISEFINKIISYYRQHKTTEDLGDGLDLVDVIGNLMESEVDRKDWYSLCGILSPEDTDENAIS